MICLLQKATVRLFFPILFSVNKTVKPGKHGHHKILIQCAAQINYGVVIDITKIQFYNVCAFATTIVRQKLVVLRGLTVCLFLLQSRVLKKSQRHSYPLWIAVKGRVSGNSHACLQTILCSGRSQCSGPSLGRPCTCLVA